MGRTLVQDVLVAGLDDWADAGWICSLALERIPGDRDSARMLSIGVIAELVVDGLTLPGDIVDGQHSPWPLPASESIRRIASDWLAAWRDQSPTPGAVVWLPNTPRGDAVARAVLHHEAGGG